MGRGSRPSTCVGEQTRRVPIGNGAVLWVSANAQIQGLPVSVHWGWSSPEPRRDQDRGKAGELFHRIGNSNLARAFNPQDREHRGLKICYRRAFAFPFSSEVACKHRLTRVKRELSRAE
jgi:hypothetical protein